MQQTRAAWFLFPVSLALVNAAAEAIYTGAYVRSHGLPAGYVPATTAYAFGWVIGGVVAALIWPVLIACVCSALGRIRPGLSIIMGAVAGALTFVLIRGVIPTILPSLINAYAIQVSSLASAFVVVVCYVLLCNVRKPYSTSN
jgi:hypothetical protein